MTRLDAEGNQLEKAVRLIEGGKRDEALAVIKDFLMDHQENGPAWELLAKVSKNPKEREYALNQSKKLGLGAEARSAGSLNGGNLDELIKQAYEQVKAGNKKRARSLIRPALQRNPEHPGVWFVKGISSKEKRGYLNALQMLESLASTNPDAKPYYDRLEKYSFQEEKRRKISPLWFLGGGFALLLILVGIGLAVPLLSDGPPSVDDRNVLEDVAGRTNLSCEQLIANALQVSDQSCQRIGSNEVCYGNYQLISEITGDPDEFSLVGDILDVSKLRALRASPLDLKGNVWGVAVFKLQANMEGTVPGQNVTFLVFGNTDITNASGDMSAFYFSTGFGGIKCQGIDFDGLQINTPDGSGIVFTANGVELVLAGNAIMSANAGGEMNVTMVTGSGTVSANGVSQEITSGTFVSVPIDENLEASGTPSEPQSLSQEQVSLVCQLFGIGCPPGTSSFILTGPTPTSIFPQTPTETATLTLTPTSTFTLTPVVFGSTSTPTKTKTPAPTNTKAPTSTSPPPTTPATSCSAISFTGGAKGVFTITNNNASPIVITSMTLTWPAENEDWQYVKLGNATIGNPQAPPPTASITFSASTDKRTIPAGGSLNLSNFFESPAAGSGYTATVQFDIGCPKTRSN